MKLVALLVLILLTTQADLLRFNIPNCIRCVCHAVSKCFIARNCSKFSISIDYWRAADSPMIGAPTSEAEAFYLCQNNDKCIYNTIEKYINNVGQHDCNCDGQFDCDDFLFLHFGKCRNPNEIPFLNYTLKAYMECMNLKRPIMHCEAEEI